jgi:hypothetical protein
MNTFSLRSCLHMYYQLFRVPICFVYHIDFLVEGLRILEVFTKPKAPHVQIPILSTLDTLFIYLNLLIIVIKLRFFLCRKRLFKFRNFILELRNYFLILIYNVLFRSMMKNKSCTAISFALFSLNGGFFVWRDKFSRLKKRFIFCIWTCCGCMRSAKA